MNEQKLELVQTPQLKSLIDNVNVQTMSDMLTKIKQFQALVQSQLVQNHDYGIIPGTPKPTLLKPGAEKIQMLMGITSEYDIVDKEQNYEEGFFAFTVKCLIYKGEQKITEGLGHCNSKEAKYIKQNACTIANTCLKMAKKRAQIDATLTVASLSQIFTQDLEDIDLNGITKTESNCKIATDNGATITEAQSQRMFAIADGDKELLKKILKNHGVNNSKEITKIDYPIICEEIKAIIAKEKEGNIL